MVYGYCILMLLGWFTFVFAYCERKRKATLTASERATEAEEDRFNSQW